MKNEKVEILKEALRSPFAWPGGYEKGIYLSDGERICSVCARKNFRQIVSSTKSEWPDDWTFSHIDVYWEGEKEHCCNCDEALASEYGPIEETV